MRRDASYKLAFLEGSQSEQVDERDLDGVDRHYTSQRRCNHNRQS